MNWLRWGVLFVAAVFAVVVWQIGGIPEYCGSGVSGDCEYPLLPIGVILFASIALLPLVGIPVSPLWVAGGATLGIPAGVGIALVGLFCNLAIAFWLAHHSLRAFIKSWLDRRGWSLPNVDSTTSYRLTLLVRVTPGLPLFAQNYLLGVAGVPFPAYIWVSMAVQGAYAIAFVVFGEAALSGRLGILVTALLAIAALAILFSLVLKRLKSRTIVTHEPP